MSEITLAHIEARAQNYAESRALLARRVQQLNDELDAAKRRALPLIQSALATAKAAESELANAIDAGRALFKRPRTQVMHGIKIGVEKGKGTVIIDDAARTVALIRKHLPADAELLIKVSEKPIKSAIANLSVADCKRIGATLQDAGDQIVIRPVDSALEKMVDALMKADAQPVSEDDES